MKYLTIIFCGRFSFFFFLDVESVERIKKSQKVIRIPKRRGIQYNARVISINDLFLLTFLKIHSAGG